MGVLSADERADSRAVQWAGHSVETKGDSTAVWKVHCWADWTVVSKAAQRAPSTAYLTVSSTARMWGLSWAVSWAVCWAVSTVS
jgi:hypothetical protein